MGEEKPYGIIYVLTSPSGKQYVGQTRDLKARMKSHKKSSRREREAHLPLYRSIKKYGFETFNSEVVAGAPSQEELNQLEILWIAKLDSTKTGLNVLLGGLGHKREAKTPAQMKAFLSMISKPSTEEHKRNISLAHKGMKKPWTSERNKQGLSEESRKKISDSLKRFNEQRKLTEVFPHGERRGYDRGCKCADCKRAAAAYARERRGVRNEQKRSCI